jgi:hypothetical protein
LQAPAGHEKIKVRIHAMEGDIDIFARKCSLNSTYSCSKRSALPNETYFSWSSTIQSIDDMITIVRNDPKDSIYLVTIVCNSYTASYQISYSLEGSHLELQPGIAVIDHVFNGEADYFIYFLEDFDENMKFVLTPLSG